MHPTFMSKYYKSFRTVYHFLDSNSFPTTSSMLTGQQQQQTKNSSTSLRTWSGVSVAKCHFELLGFH